MGCYLDVMYVSILQMTFEKELKGLKYLVTADGHYERGLWRGPRTKSRAIFEY